MKVRFVVFATVIACVISFVYLSSARAADKTETATATTRPNGPEAFSNVAPLSPAQHQMLVERFEQLRESEARRKGQVSAGPQAPIARNSRETTVADLSEALPAPGALYIGSNKSYPIVGDGQSTVAEPAIANDGNRWLATQNWSRGYSNNAGATWTGIPDDSGPSDAPFFCCDQDAVHDHGRNRTIWSELFVDSGLTTGVIRLHVRNANNLSDACTYDINAGAGVVLDYPHLGLGNDFLYITANVLTTSAGWVYAEVWRYPLDPMLACGNLTFNFFTWTGSVGQVVWVPARGTTDTMYLVTIENASQNRYFVWPENSGTIYWNVLNAGSSNFGAATCNGGASNSNWLADTLSTSAIGFQTRSAVGQDGSVSNHPAQYLATYIPVNANGSGRPQAYVAGSIIGTERILTASGIDSTADIFSSGECFSYSDVTANSRGDLGLMIGFGGSAAGGAAAAASYLGISDSFTRGSERGYFQTVSQCAPANDNPTRWGDFLTVHPQEPVDVAFSGAGYGDESGVGKVRICEFLRGRYAQSYLDRRSQP